MSQNKIADALRGNGKAAALILCVMPWVCSIIFRPLGLIGEADMKIIMRLALAALGAYAAFKLYRGQLRAENIVALIVIAGCIVRTGYTLYTHAFTYCYDIGVNKPEGVGHWGYLYQIVNGNLPPSNEYQFYQPPLYYMISAVFVRIMMFIKRTDEIGGLEYITQLVSCTCSIIVLLTVVRIMDTLNIKKSVQIIPAALLAVYPVQIMTGGRMNNDSMVQMFMALSLYATLRWHKSGKLSDIIFIALAIGLGMMTKINCGIIAIITGPVMIYHFVRTVKTRDKKAVLNIIAQLAVFAVICFPLGLWYGIRNYVLFGQPLTFVHELPKTLKIYTGNEPFVKRWLLFPPTKLFTTPFSDMENECNVWLLLTRSGVHEEFTWANLSLFLARALNYAHLLLILMTLAAVVFTLVKNKTVDKTQKYAPLAVWLLIGLSFIQFNVMYPYSCTADFRYVLPAQIASSFFTAYMVEYCFKRKENQKFKYTARAYAVVVSMFCVISVMHFC